MTSADSTIPALLGVWNSDDRERQDPGENEVNPQSYSEDDDIRLSASSRILQLSEDRKKTRIC